MPFQIQVNQSLSCWAEQLLKNPKFKPPFAHMPSRQAMRSNCFIIIFIPYNVLSGGGGLPQIGGGGGFSGLDTELDTDGQPYPTILFVSQGFQLMFRIEEQILDNAFI